MAEVTVRVWRFVENPENYTKRPDWICEACLVDCGEAPPAAETPAARRVSSDDVDDSYDGRCAYCGERDSAVQAWMDEQQAKIDAALFSED